MNIEFCRVHGCYYVAVEIQNDYTGNYKTHFRKVPDLNKNNERIIRVDSRSIDINADFEVYRTNEQLLKDGIKEYKQWKREYRV